jgi:hypothetical protein
VICGGFIHTEITRRFAGWKKIASRAKPARTKRETSNG